MKLNVTLLILRIYLGVIFAFAAISKLRQGAAFPETLKGYLTYALQTAHPFYAALLKTVILPHVATFAWLDLVAECCVAVALLTGTATRLASVVAMFLLVNYMFSKGLWWWNPASNDGPDFMIALVIFIGAAGRTFGVDAWFVRRWARGVLW